MNYYRVDNALNTEIQRKILALQGLHFLYWGHYHLRGFNTMAYKDKEKEKQKKNQYYQIHKTQILEKMREYYQINKEKKLTRIKLYYQSHKEQIAKQRGKYYQTNKTTWMKKYYQTPKRKEMLKKYQAKRVRELGFNPLNSYFKGSHAHHIDNNFIVYIQDIIHRKYYRGTNRKLHRKLVLQHYGGITKMIANARQVSLF